MSSTDRELLARALEAEAGNQGLPGMMAAGSVIMNRTRTPGYGGNLRGVILKPGQFSAFNSVTGYAGGAQGQDIENIRVSDTAYQAADALLSGKYEDPTGGATHFYNPKISNPSWGDDASGNWTKIGAHVFGKADAGKSGQDIEVTELPSIPEQRRAGAIQFEEVDPTLRQRNAAIQGEAVNSFVPNANANNVGPRQNMQAQTGLLAGNSPQNMMGAGQAMQAEEPSKGFFDNDKYKNMAAVLAQGFAAMGKNPALQKFASQVAKQRTEAQAKNKTIEFLRKSGREDLAGAVESGSIGARGAAKVLFTQPKASTAKEMQIQRLVSTGVPIETAIGIADGRLVVSRDPITGNATIVDKAALAEQESGQPAVEAPVQTDDAAGKPPTDIDELNKDAIKGALGSQGLVTGLVNTIADSVGLGQPAENISKAAVALNQLSTITMLGLSAEFPGRPSNLTRERIEELTIKAGDVTTGRQTALSKAKGMVGIITQSLNAANAVLDGAASAPDKSKARQSRSMLEPLLASYEGLVDKLQPDTSTGSSPFVVRPDVAERVKDYYDE